MITIAHFTSRKEPRWDWFCDSLANQIDLSAPDVEVLFIDFWYQYEADERMKKVVDCVKGRFPFRIQSPKPTVWQGVFRKTPRDWFAASNARNTAFALCKTDYIACVDDLCVLMPGWVDQVRHAARHQYLVMGMYEKRKKMVVESGVLIDSEPSSRDSRWGAGSDTGIVPYPASSLFGCSFGLPISSALLVDGFDEICDGTSMEDVDFGTRLSRTGIDSFLNRRMLTIESEEDHAQGPIMVRHSLPVTGFTPPPDGKPFSDWYIVATSIRNPGRIKSQKNEYPLDFLRELVREGKPWPQPTITHDWRDGRPLGERNES